MLIAQVMFDLMTPHLTHDEYLPVLLSCSNLYMWDAYMCKYIGSMQIDLRYIIKMNNITLLKWLNEHLNILHYVNVIDNAAKYGYIEMIQWAHDNNYKCTYTAYTNAANYGHYNTITWLYNHYPKKITTYAVEIAAKNGHISIIKFLYKNGCDMGTACEIAATMGHYRIFLYLYTHSNIFDLYYIINIVQGGHINILKHLCIQHIDDIPMLIDSAARYGHYNIVRCLFEKYNKPGTISGMLDAVKYGHDNIVQYYHEVCNQPCTVTSIVHAINTDNSIATYLYDHSYNLRKNDTKTIFITAVKCGHLYIAKQSYDILRYIPHDTLRIAVAHGHFNIITWLCTIV